MNRRLALASPLAAALLTASCASDARSQEAEEPVAQEPVAQEPAVESPPIIAPQAVFETVSVYLEVARTDAERAKGLGGHAPLGETDGMLFVFDRPAAYAFWMKGMLFPIDLMWIENGQVVFVQANAPHPGPADTDQTLPIYAPSSPATYVLEVNAGFAAAYGIGTGTPVQLLGV